MGRNGTGRQRLAGFTGGTGGRINAQDIESWTFAAADSDFFA